MSDHDKIYSTKFQDKVERNTGLLLGCTMVVVAVAGIVEIVPLFYLDTTMTHKSPNVQKSMQDKGAVSPIVWRDAEKTSAGWQKGLNDWKPGDGVRPYKPLELAGRAIFIREGCYTCHSQMIRPFRDEKDRYGHYSVSSESMYDHPFQWGSKRTGPDLARVGGKYSDEWHIRHLRYPQQMVPGSVMPNYFFLENATVSADKTKAIMETMSKMPSFPAPYKEEEMALDYVKAEVDGKTEMQAIVAYLQSLGNHIQFTEGVNYRD